jgi:argininosuccinate synthase
MFRLTRAAAARPDAPERITIGFESGVPVRLDGTALDPVALLERLNTIAGAHGVGRADVVESRRVGMKSRGVYETPAGTVLHEALEDLCRLTLPHDVLRTRAELSHRMADLVYNGEWFSPLRLALQAFVDTALAPATGNVTVELFQGGAHVVGRESGHALYRPDLASFDMTGYDARHAEGFIRLFGLPLAEAARRDARIDRSGASLALHGDAEAGGSQEAKPADQGGRSQGWRSPTVPVEGEGRAAGPTPSDEEQAHVG